ncbi:hypothetical protein NT6N_28840 [Oceaniferula spumae]|uniref:N-acetyltransferase domain-containing protein n=1 Tax=Oceaniferula spumae TaxID=2979115 RepID=A0AAT9FPH7_9BACT
MQDHLLLNLRDGTPVVARPLDPSDREGLAEGYRRLSPEARYQRFWVRTGDVISDSTLDRLLNTDTENHSTWAILDRSRDYPGLGAASFWRSKTDPTDAEFSVTVLDTEQGRGIGTLLLAILWIQAYQQGIETFTGYAMPENQKAIDWLCDTGATGHWDGYQAIFRWNLNDVSSLPMTPAAGDLAQWLAELTPA